LTVETHESIQSLASTSTTPQIRCVVITIFPEMMDSVVKYGITSRAATQGLWSLKCINPRDFTESKSRRVDDRPYGGGPGMVMQAQPLKDAVQAAQDYLNAPQGILAAVIYMSPQGVPLTQELVRNLVHNSPSQCEAKPAAHNISMKNSIDYIIICGRYEGVDERFVQAYVDLEVSVGDFVLSGGELPAMTLIDAMVRLLPGACGHKLSTVEDSFSHNLLDHAHYTRPEIFEGQAVPSVLLQGDHKKIKQWRQKNAYDRTLARRPDLLKM